jgi:transcriptional regulator with PAS, ATPase and Fis domain
LLTKKYLDLVIAKKYLIQNLYNITIEILNSIVSDSIVKNTLLSLKAKYLLVCTKRNSDTNGFTTVVDELFEESKQQKIPFITALCLMQKSIVLEHNPPMAMECLNQSISTFKHLGANFYLSLCKSHLQRMVETGVEKDFYHIENYLFLSSQMKKIRGQIADMLSSKNPTPAIILGPSGSGKSGIAKIIHRLSGRTGEFIHINCPAIPETLIESELFGYEKGAFTGALQNKMGMLDKANGGTLFLDELAESSPEFQKKLLLTIENKNFYSVGSSKLRTVDVLFIAATNKPLDSIFTYLREDLFYRFPCQLFLGGLDERRDEILVLANEFLKRYGEGKEYFLTKDAQQVLLTKKYSGNIRTLENNIRNAINKANGEMTYHIQDYMIVDSFYERFSNTSNAGTSGGNNSSDNNTDRTITLEISDVGFNNIIGEITKTIIDRVLKKFDGSPKKAREYLQLNERTMRRYMQVYNIREN